MITRNAPGGGSEVRKGWRYLFCFVCLFKMLELLVYLFPPGKDEIREFDDIIEIWIKLWINMDMDKIWINMELTPLNR